MQFWDLDSTGAPGAPDILASTDEGRAIVVRLAAGDALSDHQVHERAWLFVSRGTVEVNGTSDPAVEISAPALITFDPAERHALHATSDATLLLLLTPWPGNGHPGATPLEAKAQARELARERSMAGPSA
jgi:quercetin dioxygenase-like cupin family protein